MEEVEGRLSSHASSIRVIKTRRTRKPLEDVEPSQSDRHVTANAFVDDRMPNLFVRVEFTIRQDATLFDWSASQGGNGQVRIQNRVQGPLRLNAAIWKGLVTHKQVYV